MLPGELEVTKDTIRPRWQMRRRTSGERISDILNTLDGRMMEGVIGEMHKEATGGMAMVVGVEMQAAAAAAVVVANGVRAVGMLDGVLLQERAV